MKNICLKFLNLETAHSYLYDLNGEAKYQHIIDMGKQGLPMEAYQEFTELNETAIQYRRPIDGSYCVNILVDVIPKELEPFIIKPRNPIIKLMGED